MARTTTAGKARHWWGWGKVTGASMSTKGVLFWWFRKEGTVSEGKAFLVLVQLDVKTQIHVCRGVWVDCQLNHIPKFN